MPAGGLAPCGPSPRPATRAGRTRRSGPSGGWINGNGSHYDEGVAHSARRPFATSALLALIAVVALVVAGLGGCSTSTSSGSGKPLVVATTTQLADFARVVGGDDVEVYGLLRPNLDAHDFEPSPADLDALARADVVVENGLGLEPWLTAAVKASGTTTAVIDTSKGAHLLAQDASGDGTNPHLWFDPRNARVMVDHVADAVAAAVPNHAAAVRARATAYDAELARLDTWIAAQLRDLPNKKLVTDHDALPYYVHRYGLTFVGSVIPSFDSSAEVSAADLNDLADRIAAQGVKAVFTEQSLPTKTAEALARKAGVEVVSGEDGLYGDSLGPNGSAGATYLTMMRHNTATLVEHLS